MKEKKVQFPAAIRKAALAVESDIEGFRGYLFQGADGSQAVFWESDVEAAVKPDSHDFDEYCLVVEGSCEETIDGQLRVLRAGDEIFIPAGTVHSARVLPGYRAIDYFGGPRVHYKQAR